MHEPAGYELATSIPVTRRATVPRLVTGRFRTLEEADTVIRAGDADLVGLMRAHIADPDIVKKTVAGHPERVRPCIACNQGCLAGIKGPANRIGCTVNAGAGLELKLGDHLLKPVSKPRRVLIVGGGPAGMEAARVAATRGHKVTLLEAEPALGGRIRMASKAPTRATMGDITQWLEQEVYRLGVDVRLSTFVDPAEVLAMQHDEGFDDVIVATGSTPRMDGIQVSNPGEPIRGFRQPHVLSSWDLMLDDRRSLGRAALVIDETGHFEAVAVTEMLQVRGLSVTYITRHTGIAPQMEGALMVEPALQRIRARGGFTFHPRTRAVSIDQGTAVIAPTYLKAEGGLLATVPADIVVFISPNRSNRDIYDALRAQGAGVRIVGDANSPRYLPTAISEGHRAGASV